MRRNWIVGAIAALVLAALGSAFLEESGPRAQAGSTAEVGVLSTRRYQVVVVDRDNIFLVDGDLGSTWRLGRVGGAGKNEEGWVFLPREVERAIR